MTHEIERILVKWRHAPANLLIEKQSEDVTYRKRFGEDGKAALRVAEVLDIENVNKLVTLVGKFFTYAHIYLRVESADETHKIPPQEDG